MTIILLRVVSRREMIAILQTHFRINIPPPREFNTQFKPSPHDHRRDLSSELATLFAEPSPEPDNTPIAIPAPRVGHRRYESASQCES